MARYRGDCRLLLRKSRPMAFAQPACVLSSEARGIGYQTAINDALRAAIDGPGDEPVSAGKLRRILREELAASGKG